MKLPITVLLSAVFVAAGAVAQERREEPPASYRTADTTLAEWLADKDARLSALIGRRVLDPQGTDVGEVEDLLATPGRDQDPVVVLSIGGLLDVGDKWHAVSLEQLRLASDGDRLVLAKTEAELKAAPNFDYTPRMGEQSPRGGVRGPSTTNSVGRLLGATVIDDTGELIGEIEDLVVSTGDKGTRAVVELGEKTGSAEGRLVTIPFDELHVELSGEEAAAVPQQARVRVELHGTAPEALPPYEYSSPEPI